MTVITRITRRDFLRHAGVGTGALVFGSYISSTGLLAENIFHDGAPLDADPLGHPHFVAIEPLRGTIIIMSHRSEMGQGIRSSLAAVLADELEADWSRVVVRQADADAPRYAVANPYLGQHPESLPKFPVPEEFSQFVDSSRSMALYYSAMRGIGAGIRLVLVRSAAKKWGVDPAECEAVQHKVRHKATGRSFDYGNLLLLAEAKKFAKNPPTFDEVTKALKPSKEWRFINKGDPAERRVRRRQGHGDRQGGLRRRRRSAGHVDGDDRALPGRQRQGEVLRRRGGARRAGRQVRREGPSRRLPGRRRRGQRVHAACGRRRRGGEHLGGVAGVSGAQGQGRVGPRVGPHRRWQRQVRLRGIPQGAREIDRGKGQPVPEQGRCLRGLRAAPRHRGTELLRPPPGPDADGAPCGGRPLRERAM